MFFFFRKQTLACTLTEIIMRLSLFNTVKVETMSNETPHVGDVRQHITGNKPRHENKPAKRIRSAVSFCLFLCEVETKCGLVFVWLGAKEHKKKKQMLFILLLGLLLEF